MRPILYLWAGRDIYRMRGWSAGIILAPFPAEEQCKGFLTRALLNAEIKVDTRWPFLRWSIYCADRSSPSMTPALPEQNRRSRMNDMDASLRDRATAAEPVVSALRDGIPSAGEWAVFCRRSYGYYIAHEVGVVDSVKPKTIWAKTGYGRRLHKFSHEDVIPAIDEAHARRICEKLDSAKAETQRRERAAQDAYKQTIGRIYAQAIEARRAATGTGDVHESAVPEGNASKLPGETNHG